MRVAVGRLGRAHGLAGWMTVLVTTDEPDERFAPGTVLYADETGDSSWVVEGSREQSGRRLVLIAGIDSREATASMRNQWLFAEVDPSDLPDADGEYYDHQLVGLDAVVDGEAIGDVTSVIHLPGQDLLAIALDGREVLVPFVEAIVPEVDIDHGWLRITAPEGLLEADDAD